jgi:hypothetical protein
LPFQTGDRVVVRLKEHRIDHKISFKVFVGTIIDAFNACREDVDHWQYRIRGDKGEYVVFYMDEDEGEISPL